ncbi:MAG: aminotransferase class IV [Planctomycetota bacterium]|nr:aminotransferase class IV [Planctomycetota bacterium]
MAVPRETAMGGSGDIKAFALAGECIEAVPVRWATDRRMLYGDGLFETIRCRFGQPFMLDAHIARLIRGARALGFRSIPSRDALRTVCETAAGSVGLLEHACLRLSLGRGAGSVGPVPDPSAQPELTAVAYGYSPPSGEKYARGYSACFAPFPRNERSPVASIKSCNFLENILARRYAVRRGFDEAILRNTAGRVAEASCANLVAVFGRLLLSPDPGTEGCLSGITVRMVASIAPRLGLRFRFGKIPERAIFECDEAFLTNSLIGVMPLTSLEGRSLGGGAPGRIAAAMRERFESRLQRLRAPGRMVGAG